jgi:outer membrane receptor protein involved in Fe transport
MGNSLFRSCMGRSFAVATLCAAPAVFPCVAGAQRIATTVPASARAAIRVTVSLENAPIGAALSAIARQAGLSAAFDDALLPARRVTLHVRNVSVSDAFRHALAGTGLAARIGSEGDVVIVRGEIVAGSIGGTIVDAQTRRPLRAVKIVLDGITRAETSERGTYRIEGVPAGTHTVTIRLIGYGKVTRSIVVADNALASFDTELAAAAAALDQVVVTGTVIPTELRAVPNAITVITAKQIEERGITRIDQLFRGDVPGLFMVNRGSLEALDATLMFSRGATKLAPYSPATDPIKTYVDGVELADPQYLAQIDPKSIERIEILTGPQASTIYGSNAINGVMQIFTKRGTTPRPRLTLNVFSSLVKNNFNSALTPQHDYSALLDGVEGRLSYNAGASWLHTGRWNPAKQSIRVGAFGAVRLTMLGTLGSVTADVTLRRTTSRNRGFGGVASQVETNYRETGWYAPSGTSDRVAPMTSTFVGQTLGITLGYVSAPWWSQELALGTDQSDTESRYTARSYATPGFFIIPDCCLIRTSDTTLRLVQNHADRRSLRYTTTARFPITSLAQATITAGADAWKDLTTSLFAQPQSLTGSLSGSTSITRQPGHNLGGFTQTQLALNDRLFITYGLRAEWNPNFGAESQPNYSPRYGVAYTQEIAAVTAKLRASYGRSTRPPARTLKTERLSTQSVSFVVPDYGVFASTLASPELGPESQQGGEGGLELYFGTHGSLVITRYNQTVDGLIDAPIVDSVRSLAPNPTYADSRDATGYGYWRQTQYLNIGSIRNQGWELQGSVNTGPFTTKGTYSWTKSRAIGISPKYRGSFPADMYPQYQPGGTFQYLPEHTWAMGVTYAKAQTTIALNVTGTGRSLNTTDASFLRNFYSLIRLDQNRSNMEQNIYISARNGYVLADATMAHRFSASTEGVIQLQNLADRYPKDYDGRYPTIGRQTRAGLRIRL